MLDADNQTPSGERFKKATPSSFYEPIEVLLRQAYRLVMDGSPKNVPNYNLAPFAQARQNLFFASAKRRKPWMASSDTLIRGQANFEVTCSARAGRTCRKT
ncbi:hypothetical protein DFAR_1070004 [Desulfarculales bacterium]